MPNPVVAIASSGLPSNIADCRHARTPAARLAAAANDCLVWQCAATVPKLSGAFGTSSSEQQQKPGATTGAFGTGRATAATATCDVSGDEDHDPAVDVRLSEWPRWRGHRQQHLARRVTAEPSYILACRRIDCGTAWSRLAATFAPSPAAVRVRQVNSCVGSWKHAALV